MIFALISLCVFFGIIYSLPREEKKWEDMTEDEKFVETESWSNGTDQSN